LAFFSTPYDYTGISIDSILGTLYVAGGTPPGDRSNVEYYRPSPYFGYEIVNALDIRYGYWVSAVSTINIPAGLGVRPTATTISVPLVPGWNSIGVPSLSAVNIASLNVQPATGGTILTFDQASSSAYSLVNGILWGYPGSGTTYTQFSSANSQFGGASALQPWQGYWIYAYLPCTVIVPTGN
jgi:hypothetical protein